MTARLDGAGHRRLLRRSRDAIHQPEQELYVQGGFRQGLRALSSTATAGRARVVLRGRPRGRLPTRQVEAILQCPVGYSDTARQLTNFPSDTNRKHGCRGGRLPDRGRQRPRSRITLKPGSGGDSNQKSNWLAKARQRERRRRGW